jgi:phosphonate transport system substrate-binding protein
VFQWLKKPTNVELEQKAKELKGQDTQIDFPGKIKSKSILLDGTVTAITRVLSIMRGKYIFIVLLLLLCSSSLLSGCDIEERKKISLREIETTPIRLLKEKNMKIAVSAMISPKKTLIYYKDMLNYLSKKMNTPVELVQRDTYAEVNNLVKEKKITAAFVCSGAYIEGKKKFDMEILVAPKVYGETYYYSYIIVPVGSDAEKLEDLRGKNFAFTDPMSNTGKLVPTYMLAKMGKTPDSFFSKTIFTYSHDKSIEAVALNLVDGAAVDSLIWDYANATNPEDNKKIPSIRYPARGSVKRVGN